MFDFSESSIVTILLLIPAISALLLFLVARWPTLRESVTLTASGSLACLMWFLYPSILSGERPRVDFSTLNIHKPVDIQLQLVFEIEPLGFLFGLIATSLWILNSIYSIGYLRANKESFQTQFYVCFALAIFATIGISFAANLFTMFLFYELLTFTTYPLVTHKRSKKAIKAGRIYLLMLVGTSVAFFLPAIVACQVYLGQLNFVPGGILADQATSTFVPFLLFLFTYGIGKAAIIPGHFWLPAAMVAPTPVSALLHAVAVVKAGVFCLLKILIYIFGLSALSQHEATGWLAWISGATILIASIVALRQNNLKMCLAYSTVSQLSYVVLAASIFTPLAAISAAMHMAGHAVSKITLFFSAGSIYTASGKTEISQLNGIGWKMPWTMTAFAIGVLGMIGLPPTVGFISKWMILKSSISEYQWIPIVVMTLSTILNAGYFLPILFRSFFCKEQIAEQNISEEKKAITGKHFTSQQHGESPLTIVIPLCITAGLTIGLFVYPDIVLNIAREINFSLESPNE